MKCSTLRRRYGHAKKRRSLRQRRLARLNMIARKLLEQNNVSGLRKLADRYQDYDYEAEASFLRKKIEKL